ncbi:hypothetical protein FGG08_007019 [Glutinoglossum americanum]|uniref:Uncharacterized protein n=1 Tax=Glutinoglossum americanum TaxID=1670608 RepID=A0A9P8I045_9PEZI|nr:hypothetical protein FGG08_007019 [Glutinoglossum americanum]
MARQSNIFTSEGKVGQASFYKSRKKGYLVRQKGGVSAARMASDPAFANTRRNAAEFGRAGNANKLLRTAFGPLLTNNRSGGAVQRLSRHFMEIVQADTTSNFGDRTVLHPNVAVLEGFEFNADALLSTIMTAPFTSIIDRVTGHLTVTMASYLPQLTIRAPQSATHYKIVIGAAEIDFVNGVTVKTDQQYSAVLPVDTNPTAALNLQATVTPASTLPLFFVLGIQFFIMVNNHLNPVQNSNALQLVKLSV